MPAPELRPANLRAIVDDILWLNREQCARAGIQLGWRRCDPVGPVALDTGLMEAALINIVKNAIEAVLARQAAGVAGGHVELSLERIGDDTVLAVLDSADLLREVPPRQLFTPFFTTKQGGQGIGLMFVREVLMRHGLPYSLASTGQGETRFEIRFS
jgi:signal transduction histidine kinase